MAARGRPQTITDDQLLDAARAVFLEQGVGATTGAIAKQARVSGGVIFHRYKTKEALFLAVLDREAHVPPALERLRAHAGKSALADTLFDVGMSVIEQAQAMMPFIMLAATMARAPQWKLDVLRQRMSKPAPTHERSVQLLRRYLVDEAEHGRLRSANFDSLARLYVDALMHHVMHRYWWKRSPAAAQTSPEFVRSLVDVFLNGLLPRKGPYTPRRLSPRSS
jgi:AcrR family transcriptional regulator